MHNFRLYPVKVMQRRMAVMLWDRECTCVSCAHTLVALGLSERNARPGAKSHHLG